MMMRIAGFGLRGLLLLCGAVVLGLSVTLAKQQVHGSPPTPTSFGSFAGAFGIIAAAVGIVGLVVEAVPVLVVLVVDALAAIFYLAGGIALALALKGVSCTDSSTLAANDRFNSGLLNGGCTDSNNPYTCGIVSQVPQSPDSALLNELTARCTRVEVDYAFEFIACGFGLGVLLLTYMVSGRSSATHY